jgi:CubicO group peptidase (beta-lactamase class C family)
MMNRLDRLTPLLDSFVQKGPAGCSLRIAQRGETLYEHCVGYADLETKKPLEPDTLFRIFSMSKLFTCTAALILFERGLYLLNDPLEAYLPEFKNPQVYRHTDRGSLYTSPAARPIRVKDLFTMSSGLAYPDGSLETGRQMEQALKELNAKAVVGEKVDIRTLAKALAAIPLAFDPGTHWLYSMSHDVLGAFVEVVSGKKFGQFMQEEIFDPLGLKDTFFRIPQEKKHRLSSAYERAQDGTLTKMNDLDANYQPDAILEMGGAGLISSLGDYSRFAQVLARGELNGVRLLSPGTVAMMATNHLSPQQLADYDWPYLEGFGYGLGVRVLMDKASSGSNSNIGEFGWNGFLGTIAVIDPKEQLTAVYMQQMTPSTEDYHMSRIRNVLFGAI